MISLTPSEDLYGLLIDTNYMAHVVTHTKKTLLAFYPHNFTFTGLIMIMLMMMEKKIQIENTVKKDDFYSVSLFLLR